MNTGLTLETERLFLIPGSNARDDELFIQMLRKDGNFRDFVVLSLAKNIWKILEIILNVEVKVGVFIQYFLRILTSLLVMLDSIVNLILIMK